MSGCHPTELDKQIEKCGRENIRMSGSQQTELRCKHGKVIECNDCNTITSPLLHRVQALEEHKARQIDENRKISRRVDELESMKDDYYTAIRNNSFNAVKIEQLEKTVSNLVDKIAEIGNYYYKEKKQPHKCPVCEGKGLIKSEVLMSFPPQWPSCKSCEGKGLVWG